MTASEFFDQLPPLETAASWPGDSYWCPRHWAPCPLLACNGVGACAELMQIFLAEIAPPNTRSTAMLNRQLSKFGPVCCTLGDERMYELWGHWPPAAQPAASGGKVRS